MRGRQQIVMDQKNQSEIHLVTQKGTPGAFWCQRDRYIAWWNRRICPGDALCKLFHTDSFASLMRLASRYEPLCLIKYSIILIR